MTSLKLTVSLYTTYALAVLRGELDTTNVADAVIAIAALTARHQPVVVECSALEYIDCAALAGLLGVHRRATQTGGYLVLAAPSAILRRLLSLTGLDGAFVSQPSMDDAIRGLRRMGSRRMAAGRTGWSPRSVAQGACRIAEVIAKWTSRVFASQAFSADG